jgi:hypothetical protein
MTSGHARSGVTMALDENSELFFYYDLRSWPKQAFVGSPFYQLPDLGLPEISFVTDFGEKDRGLFEMRHGRVPLA